MSRNAQTLLLSVLLATIGFAQAGQGAETIVKEKPSAREGFYGERDEGWFFYKDPPKEQPQEPQPPPKPQGGKSGQPEVLSAKWIRENLDKYRYAAIDNPTKDNVELYLLLQKLAMDKAEQFAMASRTYASQNPGIDETIQNPTSQISRTALANAEQENMNKLLRKIAKRAGIYYFFRSDCPYCHQQNPMLEILTRVTGLQVLPISLDGLPSQDGLLPNWKPDQGQGTYLGVEKTPTMYLVEPNGKVLLLGVGVRAVPDISRRVIELAKDENWVTKDEYDLAMRGMPRKYITQGLDSKSVQDDPAKLLAVLREASTYGKQSGEYADMEGASTPWKGKAKSR